MKLTKPACIAFAKGCPRSEMDAARLIDYFRLNGWKITTNIHEAKLVLVSTCGFTADFEDTSIKYLSIANQKMNKDAHLIAFGCLPGINRERLLSNFNITTITRKNLSTLDNIIDATVKIKEIPESFDLDDYRNHYSKCFSLFDNASVTIGGKSPSALVHQTLLKIKSEGPFHLLRAGRRKLLNLQAEKVHFNRLYNIRTGTGCLESCSYCGIKNAAGNLKSRPIGEIVADFRDGLSNDYKIFRLIAEDVGAYGQDIETNVGTLFKEILKLKGDFRIIFDDFHPKWLIKYFSSLLELFINYPDKFEYVGIPIQSGSQSVLNRMGRDYSINELLKCLLIIKQKAPKISIHTHVIIGFPGETEKDFKETERFLASSQPASVIKYIYSDRPGTESLKFKDKVSKNIKEDRMIRLKNL